MGFSMEIEKNGAIYRVEDVARAADNKHVCGQCNQGFETANALASHVSYKHPREQPAHSHSHSIRELFPSGRGSDALFSFYREAAPAAGHSPTTPASGPGVSHVRDHFRFYEGRCFTTLTLPDGSTHLVLSESRQYNPDFVPAAHAKAQAKAAAKDSKEPQSISKTKDPKVDGRKKNKGQNKRKNYPYIFKADVLCAYERALELHDPSPEQTVADASGVHQSLVSKWKDQQVPSISAVSLLIVAQEFIFNNAASEIWNNLRPSNSKPKFPLMEKELLKRFTERRKKGRKVSAMWLVVNAKEIMAEHYPAEQFVASRNWRGRFAFRNGISRRKKTNAKDESLEERLPRMQDWHRNLRAFLIERRPNTDSQFTAQWGRFPPHLRFNVDQVGIAFIMDQESTFDFVGNKRIWIKLAGSGALEKRQATLQLCFSPDDGPQPRGAIVFRGTGVRISRVEKQAYDKRIDVCWQRKAWVDRPTSCSWMRGTMKPAIVAAIAAKGGKLALLYADNLDGQTCDEFKEAASESDCFVYNLPPRLTDELQPVDAGYGREVKREFGVEMNKWLESDKNLDAWERGLSASQRRILMTKWVRTIGCCVFTVFQAADAIDRVNANAKLRWRYFEKTGCLMTADGTNDSKIQPEHTISYSFAGAPAAVPEKKAAAMDEGSDSTDTLTDDSGSEREEFDSDDDADEKKPPATLAQALPDGWRVSPVPPAIDKELIGRQVLFKWNGIGWAHGVVSAMRKGQKAKKYNFEITYDPGDLVYPHKLAHSGYTTQDSAAAGGWCVLVPV